MPLTYKKPEHLQLRQHPDFNEAWVQQRIADDPSILGLGEIELLERERSQGKAGRLDLLLSDPDNDRRFEVELMLGATDPSHVIRTIEYWDIERRRYPAYDHVAVLVAENITSRFLNVLALFSGSIPLIAIQLNALRVDDAIVLDFVRVLDQTELRTDDVEEAASRAPVDRGFWEKKASSGVLDLADKLLEMINATSASRWNLNYNRQFVGLNDGNRSRNFVVFRPRRKHLRMTVVGLEERDWADRLSETDLDISWNRKGRLQINVSAADLDRNGAFIRELLGAAVIAYQE